LSTPAVSKRERSKISSVPHADNYPFSRDLA
jgi:hypothetical protein